MPRRGLFRGAFRLMGWSFLFSCSIGCANTLPITHPSLPSSKPAPLPYQPAISEGFIEHTGVLVQANDQSLCSNQLTLNDLLTMASQRQPELAIAAAKVAQARGEMIQAGLYPNPSFGYMGNQINDGPGTAGQQGAYLTQEFVTGHKLSVARRAGEHGLSAADWQATNRWYETMQRVRSAYYEYQAARNVLTESDKIVAQFEEGLKKADNLARAGTVMNFEVLRFGVELTEARNRVGQARERLRAAERLLATATGVEQLPGGVVPEELPTNYPKYDLNAVAGSFERTSYVQEALAMAEQARGQLKLAELQSVPNLQVQVAVMYDFAIQAPMANVQSGVMLPVFNKNQGNILAARSRLAEANANADQTRLRLRERLTMAFQKMHNAQRQVQLLRNQILPDAKTALDQVEKLYETKGERFFETLDARRLLARSRIEYQQSLGELWQAIAEIEAILQPTP